MSEFHPRVVALTGQNVHPHPNADTLSIANIDGVTVVFKTADFAIPGAAAYIPEDAIMPDKPEWAFLGSDRRVKSKKIRGILSVGMLAPIPADAGTVAIGGDVTALFGITKHQEPDAPLGFSTATEKCPFEFPTYTDIESYQKYRLYQDRPRFEGVEVVITEKIHGTNARFVYRDGRLWVGSRTRTVARHERSVWWRVAEQYNLEERLRWDSDLVFFGEIYGPGVQNLEYGIPNGGKLGFRVFDIFSLISGRYVSWFLTQQICQSIGLETVPVLYQGLWTDELTELRNGQSTLGPHHREGFVVKPVVERYDDDIGRAILKYVGEEYRESKGRNGKREQILALDNKLKALQARFDALIEAVDNHSFVTPDPYRQDHDAVLYAVANSVRFP